MIFEKQNNIKLFVLNESTLYKNGYLLGLLSKENLNLNKYLQIKKNLYEILQKKYTKKIYNLIIYQIQNWIKKIKNKYEECIQDIIGFSHALGIFDDTILEVNILLDIFDYMCTLGANIQDSFNLRILDLDKEFKKIIIDHNIPLSVIIYKIKNKLQYISFCHIGFFNFHTTFINESIISTFSWNNLDLKTFIKNEIPPLFKLKYNILKFRNIKNIYNNISNQNIIYDGYVMLMNKEIVYLYDFNSKRNNNIISNNKHVLISDFDVNINMNLNKFMKDSFKNIPSKLRCFSILYDFKEQIFYINNHLYKNEFIKINLNIHLN